MSVPVHTRRTTCRLCESPRTELVAPVAPIPIAEKYLTESQVGQPTPVYPVDLHMCLDCTHVQILDVIDPAVLWAGYTYHSGQTKGIVDHFEQVAQQTLSKQGIPAGRLVLDIGSNDGSLLRPFKRAGMQVLGVDPAEEIARKATDNGIETIPALFTPSLARRLVKERGPASVITAFNVYAHTDDLRGMTEAIRILLAPDGIFIFEAQYLVDILDKTLLATVFHEHLSNHSVRPMKRFLESLDLELIDVERATIQLGSIIGTVQVRGGPRPTSPSVATLLELERSMKLDDPATLRSFGDKLARLREEAGQLVASCVRDGKTIAGYGAARSGPTLINQLGIGKAIRWIFDDHPQKVGLFTPGDNIPVVPTAELYARRPDYVFILAWVHVKKIIRANRRFVEEGGRFVICTPEVEVVGPDHPYLAEASD